MCGKPTWRPNGICIGRQCGYNEYYRDLRRRKNAEAAERARQAEEAANQDACARVMDQYVEGLLDEFEPAAVKPAPPPPPAAWTALSENARSELMLWIRQAIEADRTGTPSDAESSAHQPAAIASH